MTDRMAGSKPVKRRAGPLALFAILPALLLLLGVLSPWVFGLVAQVRLEQTIAALNAQFAAQPASKVSGLILEDYQLGWRRSQGRLVVGLVSVQLDGSRVSAPLRVDLDIQHGPVTFSTSAQAMAARDGGSELSLARLTAQVSAADVVAALSVLNQGSEAQREQAREWFADTAPLIGEMRFRFDSSSDLTVSLPMFSLPPDGAALRQFGGAMLTARFDARGAPLDAHLSFQPLLLSVDGAGLADAEPDNAGSDTRRALRVVGAGFQMAPPLSTDIGLRQLSLGAHIGRVESVAGEPLLSGLKVTLVQRDHPSGVSALKLHVELDSYLQRGKPAAAPLSGQLRAQLDGLATAELRAVNAASRRANLDPSDAEAALALMTSSMSLLGESLKHDPRLQLSPAWLSFGDENAVLDVDLRLVDARMAVLMQQPRAAMAALQGHASLQLPKAMVQPLDAIFGAWVAGHANATPVTDVVAEWLAVGALVERDGVLILDLVMQPGSQPVLNGVPVAGVTGQ